MKLVLSCFFLGGILSAAPLHAASASSPQKASATVAALVQKHVKAAVKDPASVQIRNLRTVKADAITHFCGEVNAKNSFGGYTGFRPLAGFMVLNGSSASYFSLSDIDNVELSSALCQRNGF
ncbi:hypothetical protein R2537_007081 [Pseudomonas aeruginosa]|nr:hypothetical protein [Pseudomonas aeruginosa]